MWPQLIIWKPNCQHLGGFFGSSSAFLKIQCFCSMFFQAWTQDINIVSLPVSVNRWDPLGAGCMVESEEVTGRRAFFDQCESPRTYFFPEKMAGDMMESHFSFIFPFFFQNDSWKVIN